MKKFWTVLIILFSINSFASNDMAYCNIHIIDTDRAYISDLIILPVYKDDIIDSDGNKITKLSTEGTSKLRDLKFNVEFTKINEGDYDVLLKFDTPRIDQPLERNGSTNTYRDSEDVEFNEMLGDLQVGGFCRVVDTANPPRNRPLDN